MPNSRANLRNLTEPIYIFQQKEINSNGVISYEIEKVDEKISGGINSPLPLVLGEKFGKFSHEIMYANIISSKENYNLENNGLANKNVLKIQVLAQSNINFVPNQTIILVRNKKYIYQKQDNFGISNEYMNLFCVEV